jgi:hypothetical protein
VPAGGVLQQLEQPEACPLPDLGIAVDDDVAACPERAGYPPLVVGEAVEAQIGGPVQDGGGHGDQPVDRLVGRPATVC